MVLVNPVRVRQHHQSLVQEGRRALCASPASSRCPFKYLAAHVLARMRRTLSSFVWVTLLDDTLDETAAAKVRHARELDRGPR